MTPLGPRTRSRRLTRFGSPIPSYSTPQRRVPVSTRSLTLPRHSEWQASAKGRHRLRPSNCQQRDTAFEERRYARTRDQDRRRQGDSGKSPGKTPDQRRRNDLDGDSDFRRRLFATSCPRSQILSLCGQWQAQGGGWRQDLRSWSR